MALFRRRLRAPKGWNELTAVIIDMQEALEAWAARINPIIIHKQDRLTAGDGISIENDVISVVREEGGGGSAAPSDGMCAYSPAITVSAEAYARTGNNVDMITRIKGSAYQWQYKSATGTSWANTTVTGNKTDTLTVPANATRDGYSYRCRVTVDGESRYTEPIKLVII